MDPIEPQATRTGKAFSAPGGFRAHRRPLIAVALTLVMVSAVWGAYVFLAASPRVPQGILTATSVDGDSAAYRQEGNISDAPLMAGAATKLESQRNVTATSSSATSGGARLLDATITIFNLDNDLVMRRIGLALFEQLRDQQRFQQVRYVPAGGQLPVGERLPDLFVVLDKQTWQETVLPGGRRFQGKVVVRASDQYARSSNAYQSSLSPPRVEFRWRADIDYSARQTGVETSGARYQAVSRELGQEIAKQLTSKLDDLRKKHGTAGPIPDRFYPQYVPPPPFDFLEDLGARKLIDGSQLMTSTVTLWRTEERTPSEVIAGVRRGLVEEGWPDRDRGSERADRYLRATNGNEVVTVFADDDHSVVAEDQREAPVPMMIQYVRNIPTNELEAAVEAMFTEGNQPEATLLMFQQMWYRHQDLVEAYFQKLPPTRSDTWLQLARFRQNLRPEAAREALLRAHALRQVLEHKAPDASMRKMAEELGMESLPTTISPALVETLGFRDLDQPGEIVLTARNEEPVVFWLGEESEQQVWLILTPLLEPVRAADPCLRIQVLKLLEGSWSLSEHESGSHRRSGISAYTSAGGQHVEVAFTLSDDKRSIELTIGRRGPANSSETLTER